MMDLRIGQQYITTQGKYRFNFSLFYKFKNKPALMKLHNGFPHLRSALAMRHKLNVIISQLCRFADLCSSVQLFKKSMHELVHKMISKGYSSCQIRHIITNKGFKKLNRSNFHDMPRPVQWRCWLGVVSDIMKP
jgi:hypothetical protein